MKCPICKRNVKLLSSHFNKCYKNDNNWKIKVLQYNYPIATKSYLYNLYEVEKFSLPMIQEKLNGLDFKNICYMLEYYNIKLRTIKESHALTEYKERIEKTNMKRFGAINPLSKESPIYEKRNATVRNKYNVDNVFQCIDTFTTSDKLKKRGKYSTISSLNKKIMKFLDNENIAYQMEYRISTINENNKIISRYYDFKIGDLIIEAQGKYYHGDPRIFKANDIIKFPKTSFTASELWERDKFKKNLAESKGFRFLAIWETEIKKDWDNVKEQIKNHINQES